MDSQSLLGKRVFVTGATGFVGGRLAERLILENGTTVRALVRNWAKASWISRYDAELIQGDITDPEAVDEAVRSCDIVFHCASGGGSDQEYMRINLAGTENVLRACEKHDVSRLVYISSIAVHGPEPPDGADEADAYRSFGRGYSASKIAAEKLVFECNRNGRVNAVVIRPTFVWGPRSHLFTIRPLMQMAAGQFRLVDEGQGDCHAVFIETLVDAIIAASVKDAALGRAFLVTDGYGKSWREFFEPLAETLGLTQLPSLNSTSMLVVWRCRIYQQLQKRLEEWKVNPAPLWRKILRRSAKITADSLARHGVMNEHDLKKFARRGSINTSAAESLLDIKPRYTFEQATQVTREWVQDQLSFELGLVNDGEKVSLD